jgi:hypothetical protein
MDWQILMTWLAVGLAAVYVAWRGLRTWRSSKNGCAGGCGCSKEKSADAKATPAIIPAEQLVMRRKT